MNRIWRIRTIYVVLSVGLWVAASQVEGVAQQIVLGLAVLLNVGLVFFTFETPTRDSFELGEGIGKAIGYQAGFRDGFEEGAAMSASRGSGVGAGIIGLAKPEDPLAELEQK